MQPIIARQHICKDVQNYCSAQDAKNTSLDVSFVGAELCFACSMLHDARCSHAPVSFASTRTHVLLPWSTASKI